jgi:ABC-type transport system involved in cytochrome bd biosynthesis fused ATPase/permease subunit
VSTLALAAALVADGRLDGVLLAVVPLTALATFEAVAPLAATQEHLGRSRAAASRLVDLVDREPVVAEPPAIDPGSAPAAVAAGPGTASAPCD